MTYTLDVGGGSYPRGQVVLDIQLPSGKLNAEYVIGDACYIPFRSNSFSTVMCYGAINYFSRDDRFLEEVRRILKKEGILILSPLSYYSLALNLLYLLRNNPLGALRLALNTLRRRYRWYTLKGLVNKIRRMGFKIVGAYPNCYFPWRPVTTPHNILIAAVHNHDHESII